ncbi:hypothetical protein ACFRLW_18320 [Streptomyces sp. NPDC056728]|uniref:hypothetical protein n=1 Tax=Paenibacillus chitinolyticus TaxID=79263 RepID=UPI00367178AF
MRSISTAARSPVAALVLCIGAAACGSGDDGLDERSYNAGYNEAFGGAYIPTDTRPREEIKLDCDHLFRDWVQASGKQGIVRADWVEGCADVAQNKDSRFK